VEALVEARTEAKKNKDYATADSLRKQINDMGYNLLDTKEGVTVTPKAKE